MPLNYLDDLGQARAQAIVTDKRYKACEVIAETECWQATGSGNQDGYVQVFVPFASKPQKLVACV